MQMKWRLESALGVLVLLTIGAIVGEKRLLQSSIEITPASGYSISVHSDSASGGDSTAVLLNPNDFEWRCTLTNKYAWPYCGFEILFDPAAKQGLNLENYNKIRIWLDYEGPNKTTRIYLRNIDPHYTRDGDDSSTKFNQIEFATDIFKQHMAEFSLQDFFVANWWIMNYKVPPSLSHPQFDNIIRLEIQTGSTDAIGEHHFKLHKIELIGQYLNTEKWYLAIIIAWLSVFVIFISFRLTQLSQQVRQQKIRESELLEINAFLDTRSKQLEEMSKTDSLTGAFNRQGIEEAFLIGLWEWRCHKKPLSLIIMDIDHFKKVNDQYGHAIGDHVLLTMSKIVKKHIRANDLFARWGGEEFVLVCRDTRIEQAAIIAEKIRELISAYPFSNGLKVTASFGVSSFYANEPLDQLFISADEALYRAKSQGRNQVVIAGEYI